MERSGSRESSPEGERAKTIKDTSVAPASPRPKTKTLSAHSSPKSRQRSARGEVQVENHHWTRGQRPVSPPAEPRGFDNSDKNQARQSIGSCTDKVATERRIFGPWHKPDSARQDRLVQRLAPPKPLPPLDPKFDGWVNHFEYYWNIGVDIKETRAPKRTSGSGSSGGRYYSSGGGEDSNGLYRSQYHRLLKRPRTTQGRFLGSGEGSDGEHNMSASSSTAGCDDVAEPTRRLYGGTGRERRVFGRGSQSARPAAQYNRAYEADSARSCKTPVVSGLDRRYMGLQSVSSEEMQHIVSRLTRMTSAYNAKFAPNPHVWVDTAPGAHMVKREHTVA